MSVKGRINEVIGSHKPSTYIGFLNFMVNELDDRCNIPIESAIETKSNLSSAVLKEIIISLGFDYTFFETKEKLIDVKLLYSRNNVAHGNYLLINPEEYIELHENIIAMMRFYKDQIINSAILKSFRRQEKLLSKMNEGP